jgi:hypothetical protein
MAAVLLKPIAYHTPLTVVTHFHTSHFFFLNFFFLFFYSVFNDEEHTFPPLPTSLTYISCYVNDITFTMFNGLISLNILEPTHYHNSLHYKPVSRADPGSRKGGPDTEVI